MHCRSTSIFIRCSYYWEWGISLIAATTGSRLHFSYWSVFWIHLMGYTASKWCEWGAKSWWTAQNPTSWITLNQKIRKYVSYWGKSLTVYILFRLVVVAWTCILAGEDRSLRYVISVSGKDQSSPSMPFSIRVRFLYFAVSIIETI